MAVKINLLPGELKLGGGLGQALKITRMLGVISLAGFLVFALGMGAFFAISSIDLNNLNSANNSLKTQLTSLSSSESKYFILKDRLSKIKTAESFPSAYGNLTAIQPYLSGFTNMNLNELNVSSTKMSASLIFSSNSDLSGFIKKISDSKVFKNVSISSYAFNPSTGYLISLDITTN